MEHIKVGSRTFTVLYPDLLPSLSTSELADLRASIEERGIEVAVVVDEDDGIIDGINRLRIASELGLDDVPLRIRTDLDDDDKRALAVSLNKDRRQLSLEALQLLRTLRVARVAEKRSEGKSLRTIAEEEGISKSQVERDLSTVPGGTVEPPTVTGRDGRTRPAKSKSPLETIRAWASEGLVGKRAMSEVEALGKSAHKRFVKLINDGKSPADALKELSREPGNDRPPPPRPKPPAPKDILKDRVGNVLPDRLRDAFADPGLPTLIEDLEQVAAMIRPQPWLDRAAKLCDHYGFILIDKFGEHAWEALKELQLALEALRAGVPHAVCPKCQGAESNGKVCKGCRGYGAVPETRYQELTA